MSVNKEHIHQYILCVDLKSSIKDEECREKKLRDDLEKLQRDVFELNGCLDTVNWKINRAEFILACEKKRHEYFYNMMQGADEAISKDDLFQQYKKYGPDLNEYRLRLEKEKASLMKQLEELKR